MTKKLFLSITGIGCLCIAINAMQDEEQSGSITTSLIGSGIELPGTIAENEGSPLLPATLRQLGTHGRIRQLTKDLLIDSHATTAIVEGGAWMHEILQNPAINALDLTARQPEYVGKLNTRTEHTCAIVSIMWYLYTEAINKQQAFTEGSFIVLDPDLKLYNFLMYYARRCNDTLTGTNKDPLAHKSDNPFAYSRDSSQWKIAIPFWKNVLNFGTCNRF